MGFQKITWNKIAILFILILTGYTSAVAQTDSTLTSTIEQIIDTSKDSNAYWSMCVRDTTGKILLDIHDKKLMTPASNMKLLTSAAILNELGPNFRFRTTIYGKGHLADSTWDGEMYIVGRGDPSISGDFYDGDTFHVFDEFQHQLDSLGIKGLNGYLIGDDSYFDDQHYPIGWEWNDLSFYYAAQIDALSFDNNCVELTVQANKNVGDAPTISWTPLNTDYVHFVNEQIITPPGTPYEESYRRMLGTNTFLLKSKLPLHYVDKQALAIDNPALYFIDSFKKYLGMNGFQWNKSGLLVDSQHHDWSDSTKYHVLATHYSPPVSDLITQINTDSNNFYTEMMLKAAAAKKYDTQGTTDLGIHLVKDFADSIGIDTSNVVMTDGCGLSAQTLISTYTETLLLTKMRHSPYFPVYYNSLAVASEDGTLEDRFLDTPLQGDIHGKTGYISGVRSLTGYMTTAKKHLLIFSVIANHFSTKKVKIDDIDRKILELIYQKM